jgi:hypothetical protein
MTTKYKKEECELHNSHYPTPKRIDVHHIWPTGEGGPDVPENIIGVCQTGHTNVHELLEAYLAAEVTPGILNKYGKNEQKYALLGYKRISNQKL